LCTIRDEVRWREMIFRRLRSFELVFRGEVDARSLLHFRSGPAVASPSWAGDSIAKEFHKILICQNQRILAKFYENQIESTNKQSTSISVDKGDISGQGSARPKAIIFWKKKADSSRNHNH
jgi:hypothetical protein